MIAKQAADEVSLRIRARPIDNTRHDGDDGQPARGSRPRHLARPHLRTLIPVRLERACCASRWQGQERRRDDNAAGLLDGAHVEFFRGSSRVLARNTHQSQITIPAEWGFDGRRESLVPGEYRWYVWAVRGPKRATTAVVQAKLVVP